MRVPPRSKTSHATRSFSDPVDESEDMREASRAKSGAE